MTVKTLVTLPRSLVKWHLRGPLASVGGTTLFFPMLGGLASVIRGEERFALLEWRFGLWMWGLSLVVLIVYYAMRHRVKRAMSFYLLVAFGASPMYVTLLVGGFRAFQAHLGEEAGRALGAGLLIGLAALPWAAFLRRAWFRRGLESGHISSSLDEQTARWDPRNDNRHLEEDPRIARPGCLLRLLPWVGPAIGASLSDVFGRASAMTIVTLIFVALGYGLLYANLVYAIINTLEFRRLEQELGRPITLLPDADLRGS